MYGSAWSEPFKFPLSAARDRALPESGQPILEVHPWCLGAENDFWRHRLFLSSHQDLEVAVRPHAKQTAMQTPRLAASRLSRQFGTSADARRCQTVGCCLRQKVPLSTLGMHQAFEESHRVDIVECMVCRTKSSQAANDIEETSQIVLLPGNEN